MIKGLPEKLKMLRTKYNLSQKRLPINYAFPPQSFLDMRLVKEPLAPKISSHFHIFTIAPQITC